MQAIYPAEVLPYQTRAKGLAFLNIVVQASSCVNTFGLVFHTCYPCRVLKFMHPRLPVAFQKIAWKILLIFLFWDAFEFVVIYFFVVETKNLTLEEMDEVRQSILHH